jgi:hypothetical protein
MANFYEVLKRMQQRRATGDFTQPEEEQPPMFNVPTTQTEGFGKQILGAVLDNLPQIQDTPQSSVFPQVQPPTQTDNLPPIESSVYPRINESSNLFSGVNIAAPVNRDLPKINDTGSNPLSGANIPPPTSRDLPPINDTGGNPFSGFKIESAPTIAPTDDLPQTGQTRPRFVVNQTTNEAPTVQTPYPVTPTTPGFNPNAPLPNAAPRTRAAEEKINAIKNKEYGFKKFKKGDTLEEGQTVDKKGYILDADGKRIAGKNRDSDHNWWDSVKSMGIGALHGLLTGGLGGAIGGAITGGVRGAIDRDADEKMIDEFFKLPAAEQERVKAMAADEFESKMQTAAVARENVAEDNRRNAEQFSIRESNRFLRDRERYRQREEQEKRQAEREGNRWKPYTDEQGRRWKMYNDGRQEAIPDPDDATTQDIDPNYKTYQVYSPASRTMVTIRGRDLYSAENQTERTNTTIANQDSEDEIKYQNDTREFQTKQGEYDAKIQANQTKINGLIETTNKLIEQQNGVDTNTREGYNEAARLKTAISKNQQDIKNLEADNTRLTGEKSAQKPPVKPAPRQRVSTTQTAGKYAGQVFATPESLQQYFPGKTPAQIREIVTKNGGAFQK